MTRKAIKSECHPLLCLHRDHGSHTASEMASRWTSSTLEGLIVTKTISETEQASRPAQSDCRVYTVPEAGRILGLNRSKAYAAARSGEIPTLRFGKVLRVPAARLH